MCGHVSILSVRCGYELARWRHRLVLLMMLRFVQFWEL